MAVGEEGAAVGEEVHSLDGEVGATAAAVHLR